MREANGIGKQTFLKQINGGGIAPPLLGVPGDVELTGLGEDGMQKKTVSFNIVNYRDCNVYIDFVDYLENLEIPLCRLFLLCYSVASRDSFLQVSRMIKKKKMHWKSVIIFWLDFSVM